MKSVCPFEDLFTEVSVIIAFVGAVALLTCLLLKVLIPTFVSPLDSDQFLDSRFVVGSFLRGDQEDRLLILLLHHRPSQFTEQLIQLKFAVKGN